MERKKYVMRSLIMALLFFVMQTFCVVSVQADENELLAIKEVALEKIDNAFQEIAANKEEYKEYIDMAADSLPGNAVTALNAIIEVSQLDMGPEEKLDALLGTYTDCTTFIYLWLGSFLIDLIPIIGLPLGSIIGTIGFWGLILCLLGII